MVEMVPDRLLARLAHRGSPSGVGVFFGFRAELELLMKFRVFRRRVGQDRVAMPAHHNECVFQPIIVGRRSLRDLVPPYSPRPLINSK